MKRKVSIQERIFDIFNLLFMLFMVVVTIYPFYYVVICSVSDSNALIGARGFVLSPKGFNLEAYKLVLDNPSIYTGYRTTLIVVIVGTALNILMTSLCAFLLTRKDFAIKKILGYMVVFTMYFSGGLIPTYLLVFKYLGLGDSLWALILPVAINTYNMLIMKSNFMSIPASLEESAKIDGANDFIVLFRIVLPLSMSIIAVMILFYGVAHWNSWFNSMIYIRTRSKYPLQLILREILLLDSTGEMMNGSEGSDKYAIAQSIKYATILVSTIPVLLVYPFLQKFFVKGVMIGAVKG